MPRLPPIDIPTLALGRALMQMMLGGLLVYVSGRDEHGRGIRLCAAGFVLNGVSLFLFTFRVEGIANSFITAGNHLALGGSSA